MSLDSHLAMAILVILSLLLAACSGGESLRSLSPPAVEREGPPAVSLIESDELAAILATAQTTPLLLDVRGVDERNREGHLLAAHERSLPRGLIELRHREVIPQNSRSIVVYCDDGQRAQLAAQTLQALGYRGVRSLDGLDRWRALGFPLTM